MLKIKSPLVSIIMPVYNSENYIERAITSALAQIYTNYELIIIDDGSTDRSKEIIFKYKERLNYIYQKNAGASAARNNGINNSNGELIAFLDADDMWYPEKLMYQVDAYINNPEAALIHTEVDKSTSFDGYFPIIQEDTKAIYKPFLNIFEFPNLKTPSVMIPKKILDRFGLFDIELPTAEDKDLFLRCSYNEVVLYIPQKLVYCSVFPDSLSDDLRSYDDNISVVNNFLLLHPEFYKNNKKLVHTVKSRIYCEYSEDLCYKNNCFTAIKKALKSLQYKFNFPALYLIIKSIIKLVVLYMKNIWNKYK